MPRGDGDGSSDAQERTIGERSSGAGEGAGSEEDRSEQLDELMALAAIFGGDLSGPAAAVAAREAESFGGACDAAAADEDESDGGGGRSGRGLLRFALNVRLRLNP
jgi:hypothetical protein